MFSWIRTDYEQESSIFKAVENISSTTALLISPLVGETPVISSIKEYNGNTHVSLEERFN